AMVALVLGTLLIEQLPLFIIITIIFIIGGALYWKDLIKNKILIVVLVASYGFAILFSNVLVPYAFTKIMQPYQVERIYSMLGQDVPQEFQRPGRKGNKDANYNVRQSKIAIGSGGFIGKGFMN